MCGVFICPVLSAGFLNTPAHLRLMAYWQLRVPNTMTRITYVTPNYGKGVAKTLSFQRRQEPRIVASGFLLSPERRGQA